MCAYISRIQIHLSAYPQPNDQNVNVDFVSDGRVLMSTAHNTKAVHLMSSGATSSRSETVEPLPLDLPLAETEEPHPIQPFPSSTSSSSSTTTTGTSSSSASAAPAPAKSLSEANPFSSSSPHSHCSSESSIQSEVFSPASSIPDFSRANSWDSDSMSLFGQESASTSFDLHHAPSFWQMEDATHHVTPATCRMSVPSESFSAFGEPSMDAFHNSLPFDWSSLSMDDCFGLPSLQETQSHPDTMSQDLFERSISPSETLVPSPSPVPARRASEPRVKTEMRLGAKRMKKLDMLMEMLYDASLPSALESNNIVQELQTLCKNGSFHNLRVASGSICGEVDEPIITSSAAKFAFDLLNWERFRREEVRLINEEDLSPISASKEVNARMMKARRRRSKTRDWASDGRKAANMFFDALAARGSADCSSALLLLASNVSLDQMLKIAHFPVLRTSFASRFARVVEKRSPEWNQMSDAGSASLNVSQLLED